MPAISAILSIEELMNEPVTSVSKKEQRLSDAAVAISVLSNDDLRRCGATGVADALGVIPYE
jgi:iron complex outermembrane receptor protein